MRPRSASRLEAQAGIVLHGVLDLGVNLLDSARAYHRSEERIGKYVAQRRQAYVLATKCGEHSDEPHTYYDFSYRAISASIDLSLRLLQTEVIDVLQIHFGPEPEQILDDGETLRAMKDAREAGKVRFLGASPGMTCWSAVSSAAILMCCRSATVCWIGAHTI